MFRALSRAKRLRGTPFDPFGRAEVRRVERDLIVRYRAAIAQVLLSLGSNSSTEMFDVALRIATLPDLVRGYEHLKLERSAQFRTDLELALQDLAQRSS